MQQLIVVNDKYLQYKLEDFLADDNFVNWVLDKKNDKDWTEWLDKHPAAQSLVINARQSALSLRFNTEDGLDLSKQKTWSRIQESTQAKEVQLTSNRRNWIYGLLAAASVALLGVFLFPQGSSSFKTSIAETQSITLPAQSQVTLAASSELSFEEDDWSTKRSVALSGQAHFKVTKGVSFIVNTDNGNVQVLGTEFDVLSRDNSFQVLVTEGKVRVSSGSLEKVLTADMAFYKNPKWQEGTNLDNTWASKDVLFAFNNQPLQSVLQSLSFSYGLSIDNGNVDIQENYTGSFESTDNIQSNLEKILWPLRIDYEISDEKIILSSKE